MHRRGWGYRGTHVVRLPAKTSTGSAEGVGGAVVDHALALCVDIANALGWGPATAAAALDRSAAESLEDELEELHDSRDSMGR